jgi:hypothetical protein
MRIEQIKDKALKGLLSQILSSIGNDVNIEDLVDDYESEFSAAYSSIGTELMNLGLDYDTQNITYVIGLLIMNPDFEGDDEILKRPTLDSYEVTHVYEKRLTVEVTYLTEFKSYIPITNDIVRDLESGGLYHGADGDIIDEDVTDTDWVDDWIDSVQ